MNLYPEVIRLCVFCREHWPLVEREGRFYHVGPYSKRFDAFHSLCEANQIRTVLKFAGYEGGPVVSFKIPEVSSLNPHYFRTAYRETARHLAETSLHFYSWPAWKRGGVPESEEQMQLHLTEDRKRIRMLDAYEYYASQPCSENHVYMPKHVGYVSIDRKPTCNHSVGCDACWAKYEALDKKINDEQPCCY